MAILTLDPNGVGRTQFESMIAGMRQKDDASDNKSAGVYSHLPIEFSATEANEWQSLWTYLVNNCLRQGGGALAVRNTSGGSLNPGAIRITGYDVANSAFLIGAADAATNTPGEFLLLVALANNTNGTAYVGGTWTSAIDTTGSAVGNPVYLAAGGGATLTAPSGADQAVQVIGRVQTLANPGTISGYVEAPKKLGTSWLQPLGITTALIAANAVTAAKIGSGAATATQALFADGSGNSAFRSLALGDLPIVDPAHGGTGINNGTNTLTIPASGTADLIDVAQTLTATKTVGTGRNITFQTDNNSTLGDTTHAALTLFGNNLNGSNGSQLNIASIAPAQIVTAQNGPSVTVNASNGVAGSNANTAGPGGQIVIQSGAAAVNGAANANGGNISLTTGAGVGTGVRGQIQQNRAPYQSDSAADTMVTATATTRKPLVVQLAGSQVSNAFEIQNNAGGVLLSVNNTAATVAFAQSETLQANAPAQIATGQAGSGLAFTASAGVAGSNANTAGAGGAISLAAGNAAINGSAAANGGAVSMTAGNAAGSGSNGTGGQASLVAGNGAVNGPGGDVTLTPGVGAGTGVTGQVIFNTGRIKCAGTLPSVASTGFGTSPTLTRDTGSTDSASIMTVTAGTSPGSSGTLTLTFTNALGSNPPVCVCSLGNGTGSWNARATAIVSSTSTASVVINWDNNAVALTAGSTYKFCIITIGK